MTKFYTRLFKASYCAAFKLYGLADLIDNKFTLRF